MQATPGLASGVRSQRPPCGCLHIKPQSSHFYANQWFEACLAAKFVHITDSKHTMAALPIVIHKQFEQALPKHLCDCGVAYTRTRGD